MDADGNVIVAVDWDEQDGVDKLYLKNIRRHDGEPRAVAATYAALWAADLAHVRACASTLLAAPVAPRPRRGGRWHVA